MKRRSVVVTLGLALWGASAPLSGAQRPVAVSPGDATAFARIAQSCPTFNWGLVEGARRYELLVYELTANETENEGEGSESRAPAIHTRLPGTAFGWTPSVEKCLEPGGRYVWYVRSVDELGEGDWSSGLYFEVESSPSLREVAGALKLLRRYLSEHPAAAEELGGLDRPEPAGS